MIKEMKEILMIWKFIHWKHLLWKSNKNMKILMIMTQT